MSVAVFASYAHHNQEGELEKFLSALRHELQMKPKVARAKTIVFYDQDGIRLGDDWERVLCNTVNAAETLLCLMSDWYFDREACGRELGAFAARTKKLPPESLCAQFIFPVWWMRSTVPLPSLLSALQYSDATFPASYWTRGIRGMLRGRNAQGDFEDMVTALADRIAETIESQHTLPIGAPVQRFQDFFNAFEEPQPYDVRMAVIADGGNAWRPTAEDPTVAEAAARTRQRLGVFVRTIETGVHLERDCRQAQAEKQVILIVVEADASPTAKAIRINSFGLSNLVWLVVDAGLAAIDKVAWAAALDGTVFFAGPGGLTAQMEVLVDQTRQSLEGREQARSVADPRFAEVAPSALPMLTGPGRRDGR